MDPRPDLQTTHARPVGRSAAAALMGVEAHPEDGLGEETKSGALCAVVGAEQIRGAASAVVPGAQEPLSGRRRGSSRHFLRGIALLLAGLALLPTPAPGALLMLLGLKSLGRVSRLARRVEVPVRRRLRQTRLGQWATGRR